VITCVDICFAGSIVLQVLFEQFKFFLNLFFLVMALSQFIPQLRVGYLYTYWAPLVSLPLGTLWLVHILGTTCEFAIRHIVAFVYSCLLKLSPC